MSTTAGPERVKVGDPIVRVNAVEEASFPEVPLIVTVYVPMGAEVPAVSVNWLFQVDGLGEILALTALGRPEMVRFTGLVNP